MSSTSESDRIVKLGTMLFDARCIPPSCVEMLSNAVAPHIYRQEANAAAVFVVAAAKKHGIVGAPAYVDTHGPKYAYVRFTDGGVEFDPTTIWKPGPLVAKRA